MHLLHRHFVFGIESQSHNRNSIFGVQALKSKIGLVFENRSPNRSERSQSFGVLGLKIAFGINHRSGWRFAIGIIWNSDLEEDSELNFLTRNPKYDVGWIDSEWKKPKNRKLVSESNHQIWIWSFGSNLYKELIRNRALKIVISIYSRNES